MRRFVFEISKVRTTFKSSQESSHRVHIRPWGLNARYRDRTTINKTKKENGWPSIYHMYCQPQISWGFLNARTKWHCWTDSSNQLSRRLDCIAFSLLFSKNTAPKNLLMRLLSTFSAGFQSNRNENINSIMTENPINVSDSVRVQLPLGLTDQTGNPGHQYRRLHYHQCLFHSSLHDKQWTKIDSISRKGHLHYWSSFFRHWLTAPGGGDLSKYGSLTILITAVSSPTIIARACSVKLLLSVHTFDTKEKYRNEII